MSPDQYCGAVTYYTVDGRIMEELAVLEEEEEKEEEEEDYRRTSRFVMAVDARR